MQNQAIISSTSSFQASKKSQILSAAILGFLIVFAVGLTPIDAVHNASHDVRHSFAIPCH